MLAINKKGDSFTEEWIKYCEDNNIPFILIDCLDNNLIKIIKEKNIKAIMWHHSHMKYEDLICAKNIINSLEYMGVYTFPNYKSNWHFDDKLAQKYLLEAIAAPFIPSFIFYNKKNAQNWINEVEFPIVFKLKGGSGARNVKLIYNKNQANKLINQAFSKGFSAFNRSGYLKEKIRRFKEGKESFKGIFKGIYRLFNPPFYTKMLNSEKGYVYFQEFIPNNTFDIRLIVIDGKYAYGMKRMVRKNDFRASGSKNFVYDKIENNVLNIAFDVANKLDMQSVAFDFVYDKNANPLIVEVSYGFGVSGSGKCEGYWDKDLNWYEGKFNPYGWMVEHVLNNINEK